MRAIGLHVEYHVTGGEDELVVGVGCGIGEEAVDVFQRGCGCMRLVG